MNNSDDDKNKMLVEINLLSEKYKYLNLTSVKDEDKEVMLSGIYTLPGLGNFLFHYGSFRKQNHRYFHLNVFNGETVNEITIKEIKSISDINDLDAQKGQERNRENRENLEVKSIYLAKEFDSG